MTRQSRALLYYLRRYIDTHPERRPVLFALHKTLTGSPLDRSTFFRHLGRKTEPQMSAAIVYLTFLHREKAIKPGADSLFSYAHPELLKPAKK